MAGAGQAHCFCVMPTTVGATWILELAAELVTAIFVIWVVICSTVKKLLVWIRLIAVSARLTSGVKGVIQPYTQPAPPPPRIADIALRSSARLVERSLIVSLPMSVSRGFGCLDGRAAEAPAGAAFFLAYSSLPNCLPPKFSRVTVLVVELASTWVTGAITAAGLAKPPLLAT